MTGDDCVDVTVIDKLEEMVGPDVVREVIELFLQHAPQKLAAAREAGDDGDLGTVARELHSLKSSAGSIGALRLQELAENVEKLAVDGRVEPVRESLGELADAYDRVEQRLAELRTGRAK